MFPYLPQMTLLREVAPFQTKSRWKTQVQALARLHACLKGRKFGNQKRGILGGRFGCQILSPTRKARGGRKKRFGDALRQNKRCHDIGCVQLSRQANNTLFAIPLRFKKDSE